MLARISHVARHAASLYFLSRAAHMWHSTRARCARVTCMKASEKELAGNGDLNFKTDGTGREKKIARA